MDKLLRVESFIFVKVHSEDILAIRAESLMMPLPQLTTERLPRVLQQHLQLLFVLLLKIICVANVVNALDHFDVLRDSEGDIFVDKLDVLAD